VTVLNMLERAEMLGLQELADAWGLTAAIGQDAVMTILAEHFGETP
jgi:hypothetical protein